MTLTLSDWDVKVARHLHWISAGTDTIARHVDQLVYRPDFHTITYDDLRRIEDTLERALVEVRKAKQTYRRKPIDA